MARAGHVPLTPAAIATAATASLRPSTQPNLADAQPTKTPRGGYAGPDEDHSD
jgi:hypothetical protein